MPRFLAGVGPELHVDECRSLRCYCLGECRDKSRGSSYIVSLGSESVAELVVAGMHVEGCGSRVGCSGHIHSYAVVNTAVVEYHYSYRELEAAYRGEVHAREAERTVALNSHYTLACGNCRAYSRTHTHAHNGPCGTVDAVARESHVDCIACIIERIGAFIHKYYIGIGGHYRLDGAQSRPVIHRLCRSIFRETCEELRVLLLGLSLKTRSPSGVYRNLFGERGKNSVERACKVTHHRCRNRTVNVDFLGVNIELHKLCVGTPLAMAARQKPVETRTRKNYHIGLLHNGRAARESAERPVVGQHALCHGHRQIGYACALHKIFEAVFHTGISGALAYY